MKKKLSVFLTQLALTVLFVCSVSLTALAGSNMLTAEPITLGSTVQATFNSSSDDHYYKLSLAQSTVVKFSLQTQAHNDCVALRLYDSNGDSVYYNDCCFHTSDPTNYGLQRGSRTVALNWGTYYIKTESYYGSYPVTYTLSTASIAKTTDSVKIAGDRNRYQINAVPFQIGNTLTGIAELVNPLGLNLTPSHWYSFRLSSKRTVNLSCSTSISDDSDYVYLQLCDSNGTSLKTISLNTKGSSNSYSASYEAVLEAGTYYIAAATPDSGVPYTVRTSYADQALPAAPKKVVLSKTKMTYTGKALKPSVTVLDANWKTISASNYTVKYSNNKKVGKATVTVKFKGSYASYGSKKVTFKIVPKKTSIKNLTRGTKKIKVTWTARKTQTTGYQIQYSTNRNFKQSVHTVSVKNSKTSVLIKNLKSKKTYYVRIRTYKTVGSKKYVSAWSAVKSVKTK